MAYIARLILNIIFFSMQSNNEDGKYLRAVERRLLQLLIFERILPRPDTRTKSA